MIKQSTKEGICLWVNNEQYQYKNIVYYLSLPPICWSFIHKYDWNVFMSSISLSRKENFFKRILTHFSHWVWRKGKTAHFYRLFLLNPCNLDSFCFLHNNLCLKYKTSLTFLSTHLNSSCTGFIVNSNCEFELICIELCVNQKNYHCLIIKYLA